MSKLIDLLGDMLLQPGGRGTSIGTSEALKGKTIGLYFSAHWCPPCRRFTPRLAEKYAALKKAGKDFEIVFISSDRDEAAFNEYAGEMPWLALPYENRDKKAELSGRYGVSGIPTLVILDSDGETITRDGRGAVNAQSYIENFPWLSSSEGFFDACLAGNTSEVTEWLEMDPKFARWEAPEDWHSRHVLGRGWQPVFNPPRVINSSGKVYLMANHPAYGLHLAAANGHKDVVRILLDAGADLECEDGDGDTPLAWATYCGRRGVMDQLLASGADPSFCRNISRKQYESLKGGGASLEYLKQKDLQK
mmetsp:Transcript_4510/g.9998  ORF Transcript_4510/g.9998 Transcript_4510/m.9998 type:complete len:306 (+) Transcript_4510:178-1095(+)|eukprot:CAMPEP_0183730934 /NCGR_PEP_ID=MMETSP0737-20130205/33883_1 /TAXON_ID=385413 /ORGANISM="Thalassiosira miniscula, Strain CCMP1093" /LENGTH=305 /DNA_ID=CAMNT_0025963535 /DNA_START=98 /DNA_END=1015 /DNA_ORIENTATION=+